MAGWTARQERLKAKEVEAQLRCDEANARRKSNPQPSATGSEYFKGLTLLDSCEGGQALEAALGIGEYPVPSDKRSREEVVAEKRLLCMKLSK